MDGAGLTIFERIEQKLSRHGIGVDNSDLKDATAQVEARINSDPKDLESQVLRLELKVVELARLLSATLDALDCKGAATAQEHTPEQTGGATPVMQVNVTKIKKKRLNANTGEIEIVEEVVSGDDMIVADSRIRSSRVAGKSGKEEKKPVLILATDDEPVAAADKKK